MSRGMNQKFKFTYLMKIMQEKTDDEHSLTMPQIMAELEKYEVTAERKSIYSDFQDMTDRFGVEILKEQIGRETYYHVGSRAFELAEIKLLIDAIQASKFITEKKSRDLIAKIKVLVSEHQAKQLQRQVFINDRVKTMNESVYYNVDDIHIAINENKKIKFQYYKWDIHKTLIPRHNGAWFVVSPWALTWDDENYYMVAYDDWDHKIKHYRVDKMFHIGIEEAARDGKEEFKNFDMAEYSKATFGMFNGKKTRVKIRFSNDMVGVFIDRFGKGITIKKIDDNHSEINVDVNVSPQFFGWIFSLGNKVKVAGPEEVVERMKGTAKEFLNALEDEERTPRWELHDAMFSVDNMFKKVENYAQERDMKNTLKALQIMKTYHEGAYRKGHDKVPYIIHPLMIACHAFALGIADDVLIPACLLHDVLEDTAATPEELMMPEEVVEAVCLVSFDESSAPTKEEAKALYYENISQNPVASMVKLLDRCNNISTMATGFTRERMADYIDETEDYVIPLLDKVKHGYEKYYDAAFLLKYQMRSVLETLKRTL